MIRFLNRLQPWALCLLRVTLGVSMLVNGWDKVIPANGLLHGHLLSALDHFAGFVASLGMPRWLAYLSAATEFVGGIALIAGLLTRLIGFFVAINMLVALVKVNIHHGYSGSQYTLALIAMAILLVTTGAGACSLDRRLGLS
jgi:putative oxidoreductase